jgi:hypothetical protein
LPARRPFFCRRYLAVVPRPLPAAPLAVRRRNLIEVPMPMPEAPQRRRSRRRATRKMYSGRRYYRLHLHIGKVTLAAVYLRRVRVFGRSFAAALASVLAVATPSVPAAKKNGVGLRRPGAARLAGEEQLGRCTPEQSTKYYRLFLCSGKLTLAAMYLRRVRVVGRSFAVGAPPLTHV